MKKNNKLLHFDLNDPQNAHNPIRGDGIDVVVLWDLMTEIVG